MTKFSTKLIQNQTEFFFTISSLRLCFSESEINQILLHLSLNTTPDSQSLERANTWCGKKTGELAQLEDRCGTACFGKQVNQDAETYAAELVAAVGDREVGGAVVMTMIL